MTTLKYEEWMPIKGYDGLYEISSRSRIRRLAHIQDHPKSGPTKKPIKLISQCPVNGYMAVVLFKGRERKTFSVHRLVASSFVTGYFVGAQVNHKDGIRTNNLPENLEWCTAQHNSLHSCRVLLRGIGEANGFSKLTENTVKAIRADRLAGLSLLSIVEKHGTCIRNVTEILHRRAWSHVA